MVRPLLNDCLLLRETGDLNIFRNIAFFELCSLAIVQEEIIETFDLSLVLQDCYFFVELIKQKPTVFNDCSVICSFERQQGIELLD